VLVVWHMYFKLHSPPRGVYHPESPRRFELLFRGLKLVEGLYTRVTPGIGDVSVYGEVHDRFYLEEIMSDLETTMEGFFIDNDTYISPGTLEAVRALAGSVSLALEEVDKGHVFIAGRPPGHHAGVSGPALGAPTQGFCLLNTAALLAVMLSRRGGVAVLDFDVHHGNGSQEILEAYPEVMHVDLHQDYRTLYPWTGPPSLRGGGNLYNINLPPGSGDDVYSEALELVEDLLDEWGPKYLVVSAGFDLYVGDNNFSHMRVSSNTLHKLGAIVSRYRSVTVLEGAMVMDWSGVLQHI